MYYISSDLEILKSYIHVVYDYLPILLDIALNVFFMKHVKPIWCKFIFVFPSAEFSNKSKKLKLIANLQQLRESFERPCLIIETEKNSKQHGSYDTNARSMQVHPLRTTHQRIALTLHISS